MNSKITKIVLVALALIMLVGTISASAITPYTTYTYSINGDMQLSPHAYTPEKVIDARYLNDSLKPEGGASDNAKLLYANTTIELKGPKDIFIDGLNHLYIVNTELNQIIVTDEKFNVRLIISTFTYFCVCKR